MSGTGKSTVLAGLAARGFDTVDTDQPGWIGFVDGEPLWREDRMSRSSRSGATASCPPAARS